VTGHEDAPQSVLASPHRLLVAVLCSLALAACRDGYPTEDAPRSEPSRMTREQLLDALNELGGKPRLGKRWSYALERGCGLVVRVRGSDTEVRRVELEGARIDSLSQDNVSEIRVTPRHASEADPVTVLETTRWADSVGARSLLTHLAIRCSGPQAPSA
jgi:hypothetical protein